MRYLVVMIIILSAAVWGGFEINQTTVLDGDYAFNGTGLELTASDVILDCNGHSITGNSTGRGVILHGLANVTITGCTIINFSQGIFLNQTEATIERNSVYDCSSYGIYLLQSNSSLIYHNSIYNNSIANMTGTAGAYSDQKIEMSSGFMGNHWGRSSCPAFTAEDSNSPDVLDSYAYTGRYAQWPSLGSCLTRANITSADVSYGDGDVAGVGETVSFTVDSTINDSLAAEAYINMSSFNCSTVALNPDGNWSANCTIQPGLEGSYAAHISITSIYNESVTETVNVDIDSVDPQVVPLSPANDSYVNITNSTLFSFNVTDYSNLTGCSHYLDGTMVSHHAVNITGTYSSSLFESLPDGEHSWIVGCTDIAGNSANSTVTAFRSGTTAAPQVDIVSFNITSNSTILRLGDEIEFSVNVTDLNQSDVRYSYINASSINCSMVQLSYDSGLWTGSCNMSLRDAEGSMIIASYMENVYRSNDTDFSNVTVDTKAPAVTTVAPENGSYMFNVTDATAFIVNVSDGVSEDVQCSLYWNGSLVDNQTGSPGLVSLTGVVSDTAEGQHDWHVICNDSSGNTNGMAANQLIIDQTKPAISNFMALNGTEIARDSEIVVVFSEDSIDASTVTSSTVSLSSSELASLDLSGDTLTVDPYLMLDDNASYTLTLTTAITDRAGNNLNQTVVISFSTAPIDAVYDNASMIRGNLSHVNTNLNLSMLINGSADMSIEHSGLLPVNLTDSGKVLDFMHDFSSYLDLTSLTVVTGELEGVGSIIIHGLDAHGNKTVYLDKAAEYNGVCIRDRVTVSASQISDDCSDDHEHFVACDGSLGKYTCTDLGDSLKVTNLRYTAVKQMNDSDPPERVGSGISRDDRNITMRITTDEPSQCRWAYSSHWTYSEMAEGVTSPNTSHYSAEHHWLLEDLDDDDYEYFIRCMDAAGNVMDSPYNVTFTVNEDPDDGTSSSSSSSSSSSGGGGGGGGGSSNIDARKSRTWNRLPADSEVIWDVGSSDLPVKEVRFTLSVENDANPTIEIRKLKNKPSYVDRASGEVYTYLDFSLTNMYAIQDAKVNFRVEDEWIKDEDIDPESIRLLRYHQKEWDTLDTDYKGRGGSYYQYEADSPGFSYFAIAGTEEESDEPAADDQLADEPQVPEITALASSEEKQEGPVENATETIYKKPRFGLEYMQGKTKVMNGIAIMLLIIAGGLFMFRRDYIRRRPHKR